MTSRAATGWLAAAIGLLAGAASVTRILLSNPSALSNLVWAEDGLFPLCVRAYDVLRCTVDPFAGYLLFLPRVVAWPVSLAPMDAWPLATNLAAAVLAGLFGALTVLVLRSGGSRAVVSGFVALLPTIVPIAGFEAINAAGSSYMPFVFVAALAVCYPPRDQFPAVPFAVGGLLLSLTIPSSALLLFPVGYQALRHRIPVRGALFTGAGLVAGLIAQAAVVLSAANPRSLNWSLDAVHGWADVMPSALLTFWPEGAALSDTGSLTSAMASGWGEAGIEITLAVLLIGIVLLVLRSPIANGLGLLFILGLLMGALPAAAGYANNRYFVIPALLWLAGVLVALDRWLRWRPNLVLALVSVVLVVSWVPTLGASVFRSASNPEWGPMLAALRSSCATYPEGTATFIFSPAWPFVDAVFLGPTNNVMPCAIDLR